MASEKKFVFAFSGKEIFVIFTMLIIISALVFALGLKLGAKGGLKGFLAGSDSLNEELDMDLDLDLGDDLVDTNDLDEELSEQDDSDEKLNTLDKKAKEEASEASKAASKKDSSAKKAPETKLTFYKDLTAEKGAATSAGSTVSEKVLVGNKGKYTVQIAAYAKELDAESKTQLLKRSGVETAYYIKNDVPGKGLWYQVRIGFFDKLNNAKAYAENLKQQKKISEYVIKVVR